ncbi:hypothetical protein F5141DRAFT_1119696 [Pisolithus sp. B1]|nr:hypothetical protein F5141DRAFT_1119696 [Pisolithus sp. B1]
MARHSALLSSCTPSKVSPAEVTIGHVQLRDLVICPQEPGVLNYVQNTSIVEHDLYAPDLPPRTIADLPFIPNTLTSLPVPGTDKTLLAVGGQEAEIHLSLHNRSSRSERRNNHLSRPRCNYDIWNFFMRLSGSINNSVLLSSLSLTRSNESSVEPRLAVSNNDWKVKFYDVPICEDSAPKEIRQCGMLRLEEPVNHSSISPDGRTLLSVGDSPRIYLHQLTGGAHITFNPIVTLSVPPPDTRLYSAALAASFSTAFSADGMKFAVASQEGVVAVWDVRSTKPMKVIQTDKTRLPTGQHGNGYSSDWLSDDPNEWTRSGSRAPGWGARNVKFGSGGTNGRPGKELMMFTEHTNLLHVFDARTFEQEEIVHVPGVSKRKTVSSRSLFNPSSLDPIPPRRHIPAPHTTRALDEFFGGVVPDNGPIASWHPPRREFHRGDGMGDEHDHTFFAATRDRRNARTHITERVSPPSGWAVDRHETTYGTGDVAPEDVEMDVDEMEGDCVSSRGPSRSSSPPPSVHLPVQPSPSPTRSAVGGWHASARPSSRPRHRTITREDATFDLTLTQDYDYDIAGTCFDPDGGLIYVATTDCISEWEVRGASRRWWGGSKWV